MVVLNHQNSPITRAERLKLNENWVTIVEQFVKIQRQFNIVTGGKEVDELLQRIESTITSAEASIVDINELITDVRALIVTTNETIESANTAASNANTKATEAQQATQAANTATASATQAVANIERIMGEYETRVNATISNSESATAAATTATQEAITAKGQTEQATQAANTATTAANESSSRADASAQNADTAASNANQVAQNMSGYDKPIEDFSLTKTFLKHQAARFNGSTYRAKVETTGNPLPVDPAVENDWWTLEAKRGTDGQGAVASVNGQMPDDSGNVQIDVGGGTWDEITGKPTVFPPSAHQHAIDDVDGLRDALNNAGAATLERKIQHFTATEGQTTFTVDHPYTVGSNFMELVVGGIPQFSPENFTESSSTTITLAEGVPAGTIVTAIYYTGFGGVSAIPDASLTTKGLTMLETATDSDSEDKAATPKSVKTVMTKVTETDGKVTTLENNINTVEQTLTTHMDDYALLESQVSNHESRINLLENGSTSTKADVAGLNREVAYLKLQQEASERIEGGTVFADDFKGGDFGFTLDELNSSGFKIRNGKLVMVEDVEQNYNVTDSTVVASAYSTAGNGGRKLVRLSNGWLVAGTIDLSGTDKYLKLYLSRDSGTTFTVSSLPPLKLGATNSDFSLVSMGDKVGVFRNFNSGSNYATAFISINSDLTATIINDRIVDSDQTAVSSVSLAIDPSNGHLHATWASKNATYSNSFNIRYSKSVDGGVTWSTVEQVTVEQTANLDYSNPSITALNGIPLIVSSKKNNPGMSTFPIVMLNISGGGLFTDTFEILNDPYGYTQESTTIFTSRNGDKYVLWSGRNIAIAKTQNYIKYTKSSNGSGSKSWSAIKILQPGVNPTFSENLQGHLFITYQDNGSTKFIKSIDYGDSWTNPTIIGTGTNPTTIADNSLDFTVPPSVRMGTSNILFSGNWTGQVEVPTTTATAIYNIPSTDYVGAFVEKVGSIAITSFINDTAMESELDGNEYQFVGSLATSAPVTLRLELSRPDTTNGENDAITRILGGRS